jgi:2-phospho-L-lactate guanylyltransferase (CobY/MobA/RfbA family)
VARWTTDELVDSNTRYREERGALLTTRDVWLFFDIHAADAFVCIRKQMREPDHSSLSFAHHLNRWKRANLIAYLTDWNALPVTIEKTKRREMREL